jgi:hypothetical protein
LMVLLIIVIVIKKKFTNYLIKLAKFNKKSGYKQRITSKK